MNHVCACAELRNNSRGTPASPVVLYAGSTAASRKHDRFRSRERSSAIGYCAKWLLLENWYVRTYRFFVKSNTLLQIVCVCVCVFVAIGLVVVSSKPLCITEVVSVVYTSLLFA